MSMTMVVTPFNFGAAEPNQPVPVDASKVALMFQTVRDRNITDDRYDATLFTRIVKPGVEIITETKLSILVAEWRQRATEINPVTNKPFFTLARFTRRPIDLENDDPAVWVSVDKVTDVLPAPQAVHDEGYRSMIYFGGLRIPVTEMVAEVNASLGRLVPTPTS